MSVEKAIRLHDEAMDIFAEASIVIGSSYLFAPELISSSKLRIMRAAKLEESAAYIFHGSARYLPNRRAEYLECMAICARRCVMNYALLSYYELAVSCGNRFLKICGDGLGKECLEQEISNVESLRLLK